MIASRPPCWKVSDLPLGDQTGPDSPRPVQPERSAGRAVRGRSAAPSRCSTRTPRARTRVASADTDPAAATSPRRTRHDRSPQGTPPAHPQPRSRARAQQQAQANPANGACLALLFSCPRSLFGATDPTTHITPERCARSPPLETPSRPPKPPDRPAQIPAGTRSASAFARKQHPSPATRAGIDSLPFGGRAMSQVTKRARPLGCATKSPEPG